ncbi:MAG: nitroreductase family protein [Clostridia bacterium]|nr:nitroreductase family protein [Clostridia bacterium]
MSKPVGEEILHEFVENLRYIPSSCNFQALKYILVTDDEKCRFMRSKTRWAGFLKDYNGPDSDKSPTAYMVICHDTECCENETMFLKDVGISAQTVNLMACEKGIGICMIGSFDIKAVEEYFSLPENIKPKLVIALGYPLEFPVIEDEKGSVKYYRDENNIHHVPKRSAKDLIIK